MIAAVWIAIRACSVWGRLGAFGAGALAWSGKNPVAALLAVSLAGNVATIGLWRWADRDLAAAQGTIAKFNAAQKAAVAITRQDDSNAVAAVAALNGVTDHDYEDGLADGRAQLADYVRAHGVRQSSGGAGIAAAATAYQPASVPASAGAAASTVAFTEAQLTAWDRTWQDDHDCRIWASGIAALFDGKHWPTPAEVATLNAAPATGAIP